MEIFSRNNNGWPDGLLAFCARRKTLRRNLRPPPEGYTQNHRSALHPPPEGLYSITGAPNALRLAHESIFKLTVYGQRLGKCVTKNRERFRSV
ncbi:hypothetical protein GCM10027396_16580 [Insolitispirillum peregrinum]